MSFFAKIALNAGMSVFVSISAGKSIRIFVFVKYLKLIFIVVMTKLRDNLSLDPLQDICSKLQSLVYDAVANCKADSISLSGGLDSSILVSCLDKKTTH